MKILQVTGELYPYNKGGIGKVVDIISTTLAERGHDVSVLTPRINDNLNITNNTPYNIIFYDKQIEVWGNPISFNYNEIKHSHFDVIHVHSHLFFPCFYNILKGKLKNVPTVLTVHGLYSQTAPKFVSMLWVETFTKLIFKCTSNIICLTKVEKELVEELSNKKRVDLIPNGVDVEKFKPVDVEEWQDYILFVGRYVPGKGPLELLDAFSELKNNKSLKLKMVGSGPIKSDIKLKIDDLNLSNDVELLENISENDLIKLYQKAKLFVLPSYSEGLPLTILESMACGTPIVCSKLPQLEELIHGCGVTIHPGDVSSLSKNIDELVNDGQKIVHYSRNARKKICRGYSWQSNVDKTVKVYKEIIG